MGIDQGLSGDRLHALDAVRAYALLLGVVLHSCAAFLQDFPMPVWRLEPYLGPALIYYCIHVFRMSAFYLMAGFFGRMLLERRGVRAFAADRAKRILLPLVLGLPIVVLVIGVFVVLGALPHGGIAYVAQIAGPPPAAAAPAGPGLDLAHLWFLYYLLMFYALALALRAAVQRLPARGRLAAAGDRLVAFLMRGLWGPLLLAVPVALYYWHLQRWTEWLGLPAPGSLVPDVGALIGYGMPFALGWLLQRQVPTLLALRDRWLMHLLLAAALVVLCLWIIGTTPRWQGPVLYGTPRAVYTAAYMVAMWCAVFAAVGAAVRFLSVPSAVTRYLADASYWVYLMHMAPIVFFINLLRPYHLPWPVMLVIMVGGSMLILLPSYHYLVRFTWVGAVLNGRRHVRAVSPPQVPTVA
jgi:peptidoglycan/LPS O-acetylase OafA/YrhL